MCFCISMLKLSKSSKYYMGGIRKKSSIGVEGKICTIVSNVNTNMSQKMTRKAVMWRVHLKNEGK